jgi:hypothetical protein
MHNGCRRERKIAPSRAVVASATQSQTHLTDKHPLSSDPAVSNKTRFPIFKRFLYLTLFALVFLPGWSGIEISSGGPLLNCNKLLYVCLILTWLSLKMLRNQTPFHRTKWTYIILMLAFVQFCSLFVSSHIGVAVIALSAYVGYYYLLYFCVYDTCRTIRDIKAIILVLAVAGTLAGILAVYESITGNNFWRGLNWFLVTEIAGPVDVVRYGFARAAGSFGNYITLGLFLAMVWPLWLSFYDRRSKLLKRGAVVFCIVFGFLATFATISRGAIIASILSSIIYLMLFSKWNLRFKILLLIVVSIPLMNILRPPFYISLLKGSEIFLRESFDPERASNFYARAAAVPGDLKAIASNPLIGYGIGEISRAYRIFDSNFPNTVHSYYTTLAMESGLFALLLFLLLLLGSLVAFIRSANRCSVPQQKKIFIALILSTMSAALGLFPVNMTEQFTYMFAVLAVGHRLLKLERTRRSERDIDARI